MSSEKLQLPDGWVKTTLRDIVDINYGKGLPKTKRIKGNIPVFGSNGIIDYHDQARTHNPTIIIGRKGSVGKVHLSIVPCWPIDTTYYIDNISVLNIDFLCYLLLALNLEKLDRSSTIPGINRNQLYKLNVVLPPLLEQKRIVQKIERLSNSINKIKEQLDNIPEILKRFRQSALSDAIAGRLTQHFRRKSKLQYENKHTSLFSIDLPTGWKKIKIKDFTSKVGSGSTPKGGQKVYVASGTPLIRSQNVTFEGVTEEGLVFIGQKHAKTLANVEVEENDVLLNITGASIGRVTTAPKSMNAARVNQHVCIIRPNKLILPSFLSYFLSSPEMQDHIMRSQYGVTRQALTKVQILDFEVPLPHIEEQIEIVRLINSLFALANNIEKRYQKTINKIDTVKQNILAKAFRGELVPTEAELAKKASRPYETAQELLGRIKTEREEFVTHQKKRRIMKKIKDKTQDITADSMVSILLKSKTHKLPPDQLFSKAGFDEDSVDRFYELLRECVTQKRIAETRTGNNILLEGIK